MILLPLLACVLLGALDSQAEVVGKFANCTNFFYKGQEPTGMDQNAKEICQRYNNTYYFATLYSVFHKIPVYSAYTFNHSDDDCSAEKKKKDWFIEPQISGMDNPKMDSDKKEKEKIKPNQAINNDYEKTGFDRGHLNPNCLQKGEGRTATFTLTNAAPMDPCFNRVHWYAWENWLKTYFKNLKPTEPIYLVTGTVTQLTYKIPEISGRVTVPSHIWTAVCYEDKAHKKKSFSLGFIGENKPGGEIKAMSVTELDKRLSELSNRPVKIFVDDCFSANTEVRDKLSNEVELPTRERLNKLNVARSLKRSGSMSLYQSTPPPRKIRKT